MSSLYTLRLVTFKKGEVIFTEGSNSGEAYIIHIGEVDILKSGTGQQPVVLRTLGVNEMFGEMALITNNPRAASAVARSDVTLEVINRNAFGLKMQSDPEFAMQTVRRLAGMVPEAQARLLSQVREEAQDRGTGGGLFGRRKSAAEDVSAFAPDYVQIEHEAMPLSVRAGGYAVIAFLVSVVVWTSFATTDTTVVGLGRVTSTVPNVAVQPFEQGIVRQVNVREGQQVKKGEVLATLDATIAQADLRGTEQQLTSTQAQVARLRAELGEAQGSAFSDDPEEEALQRQLYAARMAQFKSTAVSNDEEMRSLAQQIESKRAEALDLERQLKVLADLTRLREQYFKKERDTFLRDGQFRVQYLEALRAQTAVERELNQARNAVAGLETQLRAKRAHKDAWMSDWRAKIQQELVQSMREQAHLAEQMTKFQRANSLVEITAPVDAIVLSVRTRTPGTVLRAAESLFELVPVDVPLEVELDISPKDTAQIQPGDPVNIKLDALPFIKHGSIDGKLRLVSEDTFEKTLNGQPGPVYRARVSIGKSHLTGTPANFRLVPGMTVSGDIKVGSRTLFTYLVYPVTRALNSSFREP